ncbi:MAG TPA: group 1 truncated hemoglobin [Candidatus Binatia bacterium]|jgi:hemoglobin
MIQTLFQELGGEARLREIIDAFIDRVFADRMIGFFFRNADRKRIKELEYQMIGQFLGAEIEYRGRPLDQAHAKHRIMGGQFARRQQILQETLEDFHAPQAVRDAWIEHNESLRPLITADSGSDCDPLQAQKRSEAFLKGT